MGIKIDKIIISNRKSIEIKITDNLQIHVRIPYNISEKELNILIKKYESQIEENLKKLKEKNSIIKKQFIDGERFLLLGRYYELKLLNYVNFKLRFDGKFYSMKIFR